MHLILFSVSMKYVGSYFENENPLWKDGEHFCIYEKGTLMFSAALLILTSIVLNDVSLCDDQYQTSQLASWELVISSRFGRNFNVSFFLGTWYGLSDLAWS